jgi:hypothetical protein
MDKFGFSDIKKTFELAGDMRRIILRGTATDTDSCQPVKSEGKSADYLFASRLLHNAQKACGLASLTFCTRAIPRGPLLQEHTYVDLQLDVLRYVELREPE